MKNERYHLFGDKSGDEEFHLYSNEERPLKEQAKWYIDQGYFVFLEDTRTGKMKEVRT